MAEQKARYREKPWDDIVKDADPQKNEPQAVYQFTGRTFKEAHNKPYEPPK